jgi:hypothetical protein
MVGVMIAPRPEDFERITSDEASDILRDVAQNCSIIERVKEII